MSVVCGIFAVKVGGMRVATHKKTEKPTEEKPEENEEEEFEVYDKFCL